MATLPKKISTNKLIIELLDRVGSLSVGRATIYSDKIKYSVWTETSNVSTFDFADDAVSLFMELAEL